MSRQEINKSKACNDYVETGYINQKISKGGRQIVDKFGKQIENDQSMFSLKNVYTLLLPFLFQRELILIYVFRYLAESREESFLVYSESVLLEQISCWTRMFPTLKPVHGKLIHLYLHLSCLYVCFLSFSVGPAGPDMLSF